MKVVKLSFVFSLHSVCQLIHNNLPSNKRSDKRSKLKIYFTASLFGKEEHSFAYPVFKSPVCGKYKTKCSSGY